MNFSNALKLLKKGHKVKRKMELRNKYYVLDGISIFEYEPDAKRFKRNQILCMPVMCIMADDWIDLGK